MSYSLEIDDEVIEKSRTLSHLEEQRRSEIRKKLGELASAKVVELHFAGQFDKRQKSPRRRRRSVSVPQKASATREGFLLLLIFALALWVVQLYFFVS